MTELTELEVVLTRLLNNYKHGYNFTKNCRDLLEKLTVYNKPIKVILQDD